MCIVLLPPGVNQIAIEKYVILLLLLLLLYCHRVLTQFQLKNISYYSSYYYYY